MSRTRAFVSGVGLGYLYQVLVMVVGLWLTPFLLRYIGQQQFGLWVVGFNIINYLVLMDLGVVALLPRDVAYTTGRNGREGIETELRTVFARAVRAVLAQVPFIALAAVFFWTTIPNDWAELRGPIGLVLIAFVLVFPLRIIRATLQGLQDLQFLGRAQIAIWAATTIATISLVILGWKLYALAAGWMITEVGLALICLWRLETRYPGTLTLGLFRIPTPPLRTYFARGMWVSLAQVAHTLLASSEILIIGKLLGPLAVVPYTCTAKLVSVLANQPQLLMQSTVPGLSEMKTGASRERIIEVSTALSQIMLMISGGVACVILAANRAFVEWWVGPAQFSGMVLTGLIVLNMMLRHLDLSFAYTLFSFGYERRMSIKGVADGLFGAGLAFALVPQLGINGAVLGMITGAAVISLPINLVSFAKETGVPVSSVVARLWPWCWRFCVVVPAAWWIGVSWMPKNLIGIGAVAAGVGGAYGLLVLPLLLRPPLGEYFGPKILAIVPDALQRRSRSWLPAESVKVAE